MHKEFLPKKSISDWHWMGKGEKFAKCDIITDNDKASSLNSSSKIQFCDTSQLIGREEVHVISMQ